MWLVNQSYLYNYLGLVRWECSLNLLMSILHKVIVPYIWLISCSVKNLELNILHTVLIIWQFNMWHTVYMVVIQIDRIASTLWVWN